MTFKCDVCGFDHGNRACRLCQKCGECVVSFDEFMQKAGPSGCPHNWFIGHIDGACAICDDCAGHLTDDGTAVCDPVAAAAG